MILSLNEIETTCYRAALGAGLTHGLAEDAAAIAARLAATRPDGAAIMLRALTFADGHRLTGPVFAKSDGTYRPTGTALPALVAGPAAADLKQSDPTAGIDLSLADEPAVIAACFDKVPAAPPSAAISVPDNVWREICALAARTYVPHSETSRLMGAGAGLLDDD